MHNKFNASSVLVRKTRAVPPKPSRARRAEEPASVDWAKRGAVTWPNEQAGCSACWAFAAVGSMETNYYLLTGEKKSFSGQKIVNCIDPKVDNTPCTGGWPYKAFDQVIDCDRLAEEKHLKYTGPQGTSNPDNWNGLSKAKLTSYTEHRGDAAFQPLYKEQRTGSLYQGDRKLGSVQIRGIQLH